MVELISGGDAGLAGARYAPASLLCASPVRNRMLASSRDVGWRSVLLDHQEGRGAVDAYDKPVTPDLCITAALKGAYGIAVLAQGRWREAVHRPGTVAVTRAGEGNRLRWQARQPDATFAVANLYLPRDLLAEAADHFRRPGSPSPAEPTSELLLIDQLVASTVEGLVHALHHEGTDLYAEAAARWLAAHLVWINRGRYGEAAERRNAGVIADRRLARVVEYVTAHYAEPLTLAELAEIAGVSPFHFSRLFQQATGATPQRFLTQHRMRTARGLLEGSDLSVAEVGRACGYGRPTSFAAAFTRMFGMSPRAVRRGRAAGRGG